MRGEIHVVAAVIWQDGRYLAVERPDHGPWAGWWEFPGGKIEPGEAREAALARELKEELNITPVRFEFWRGKRHSYRRMDVNLYFFHVFEYSGLLVPQEGQVMTWLEPGNPGSRVFLPADVEIVQDLKRSGPPRS
ncbi:(deoxy)nucleoside triphosphate pyrophosphohydrolase [Paucidesulfovibrio longus]|uniref:(deoxy)nucleoside triphosphate pyrophosphohydrolase n=1 Tax=Paucidesulfovibrio longus TaxID=889 RepID=UPI0003B6DD68|nr:(deoxy)nucleoside triphosphate pyrophosphohydrolase [Paucidesulfovibrio longus]